MAAVSGQQLAVARVYADAMIRLAEAQGEVDLLLTELQEFAAQVEGDEEFRTFISSPTIKAETRKRVLEKILRGRYSDLLVDSVQVLNRKGRLELIRAVALAYSRAHEKLRGRVEVHVCTATPLTAALREKLTVLTARRTGREPHLIETVDDSLIGGLVVRIGDEKFDASVATKLKTLGRALRDRASREIHSGRSHWEGAAV